MKKSLLFIFFLFLISCSETIGLKKFYGKDELVLNNEQIKRFKDYINKSFYSHSYQKEINAYPLMFAISKNGLNSLIIACEGYGSNFGNTCDENVSLFQNLKKYSQKEKLYIFAREDKIVWKGLNLKIKNNKDFEKNLTKYFKLSSNTKKNYFYDYILGPMDSGCDDC